MLINLAILAALAVPSIMAALSRKEMADSLIKVEKEGDLERTFEKFEEEQDEYVLSLALADVAKIPKHIPKVVTCLRFAVAPFPEEPLHVSELVHRTVYEISYNTRGNTESFAKVVASFNVTDVRPLSSICFMTLRRSDAVKVLESVMDKSPTLIIGYLPRWLASHGFDTNSHFYTLYEVTREQAFQYLTSFATEGALTGALYAVVKNQHYKVGSQVRCCNSQDSFPHDLYNKLSTLLELLKARKAFIKAVLQSLLPSVLVDLVLDHVQVA